MLDQIVQLASILIPVTGGVWAVFRYVDSRNQELRERRLQRYTGTVREANGRRPDGSETFLVENIAALYRLLDFPERRDVSIVILEDMLEQPQFREKVNGHCRKVIKNFEKAADEPLAFLIGGRFS